MSVRRYRVLKDGLGPKIGEVITLDATEASTFEGQDMLRDITDEHLQEQLEKGIFNRDQLQAKPLDLGEHNGEWYFGVRTAHGKDAVITSDGQVFVNNMVVANGKKSGKDEIRVDFGLEYPCSLGHIAPLWRNQSVKSFLEQSFDETHLDKSYLYDQIKQTLLYYMDYGQDVIYADIQALYVLASYFYPLFDSLGILFLNAPRTSGKTKNANLLEFMSFRGYDLGGSGGVSKALLSRTLQGNRGLVGLDEYEQMDTDSKKLVDQMLNASINRDAYIIIPEQIGPSWIPIKRPIFGPKVICNISGLGPTTQTRCIHVRLMKGSREKCLRKPRKEDFLELRDDLHIFAMMNWHHVKEAYQGYGETELWGREEDLWKPLLALARYIAPDIEEALLEYLRKYQGEKPTYNDYEETLLGALDENVPDEPQWFQPSQMLQLGWFEGTDYEFTSRSVGRRLSSYKTVQMRRVGRGKQYLLSKSIIRNLIDLYTPTYTPTQTPQTPLTTPIEEKIGEESAVSVQSVGSTGG